MITSSISITLLEARSALLAAPAPLSAPITTTILITLIIIIILSNMYV